MTIEQWIKSLEEIVNNYDDKVNDIVEDNGYIGGLWKRNRYNYGFEPSLGRYAPSTVQQKRRAGLRTSPFNLHNTGLWYDTLQPFWHHQDKSVRMYPTRQRLDVRGKDVHWILIEKYGQQILDFTEKENTFVFNKIIDEEILNLMPDENLEINFG